MKQEVDGKLDGASLPIEKMYGDGLDSHEYLYYICSSCEKCDESLFQDEQGDMFDIIYTCS